MLAPHTSLIFGIVGANVGALVVATVLHHRYGFDQAFSELGLINSFDAAQLAVAGLIGLSTFDRYRRRARAAGEAPSTLLWGLLGAGLLVFAFDDLLSVHERVGAWATADGRTVLGTNNVDDLITLGYGAVGLTVLAFFRRELLAIRASSTLLIVGVALSAVMLVTDAFARGPLAALEFPSQVLAAAFLLLAQSVRRVELRETATAGAGMRAAVAGEARASPSRS
jgi:hypothetical protein